MKKNVNYGKITLYSTPVKGMNIKSSKHQEVIWTALKSKKKMKLI